MSITLTDPVSREPVTTIKLVNIAVDINSKQAQLMFDIGYMANGAFIVTDTRKVVFQQEETGEKSPGADFTFDQLVNNVPEVKDLRAALEAAAVQFSIFDGTAS